jgi:Tfp pilus assembly protein PilN
MKRINLLPKDKQRELGYERVLYSATVAIVLASIILLSGVVVQFGVYTYLKQQVSSSNLEIEELRRVANKSENATVKEQIKKVNAQLNDFTVLMGQTPQWSTVLAALVKNVPPNVKITQFDAAAAKQEVTISGYSPTRDLVIDLYNNINADKEHFKNINYPLDNVTKPTDVKFSFTFTIADKILIKDLPQ